MPRRRRRKRRGGSPPEPRADDLVVEARAIETTDMSELPAVGPGRSWTSATRDAFGTASAKVSDAGQRTGSVARAAAGTVASELSTGASVAVGATAMSARVVGGVAVSSARAVASRATVSADAVRRGTAVTVNAIQGLTASGLSELINSLVQESVKGVATVYDRAMDAKYLDPLLRPDMGGNYHRLFDGGHTIYGAVQAARAAAPDDTLIEQARGVVQALLRDASTTRGLPLATWDKATFEMVASRLEATAGIPKSWLYDISTYDVADVLGGSVGVVSVVLSWNKADTAEFASIAAGMGISAAAGANPILSMVAVVAAARAFHKARIGEECRELADGSFRGAATSAAAMSAVGLVSVAGGPAIGGLLAGVTAGVLAHKATQRVSVTDVAEQLHTLVAAFGEEATAWATERLDRGGGDLADAAVARAVLALPRAPVLETGL